jgi:hypothetical protein
MEEARLAIAETRMVVAETRVDIAETLNVTHKIDDKVAVLVDGERNTFSAHPPIPKRRCKRNECRHTAVREDRR